MQFLTENSIYVTLIIASLILVGLLIYLFRVDGRLRNLEKNERI